MRADQVPDGASLRRGSSGGLLLLRVIVLVVLAVYGNHLPRGHEPAALVLRQIRRLNKLLGQPEEPPRRPSQ